MGFRWVGFAGLTSLVAATGMGCAEGSPQTDTPTTTSSSSTGGSGGDDGECAGQEDGAPCGDAAEGECDAADSCLGGECVPNFVAEGAACGDPTDTECDPADTCDGNGVCRVLLAPQGAPCGDTTDDDCTLPDTCDGNGVCLDNHAQLGSACGDPTNNQCTDPDTCDGQGVCEPHDEPADTPCGNGVDDLCTDPDTCDGAGVCQENHAAVGTACGSQLDDACTDPDTCDGGGACLDNHELPGTACGDGADTDCTDPDTCNGTGLCLVNHQNENMSCDDCAQGSGLCDVCSMGSCLDACIPPSGGLTTLYAQNGQLAGVMFDVHATADITLTRIETALTLGSHDVHVYTIAGGKSGFETNQGAWIFRGNVTVSGGDANVAVEIPLDLDLPLMAGQTLGVYLHSNDSADNIFYTAGTTEGAIYIQNAELQIFEGRAISQTLFGGTFFAPRVFNGEVKYTIGCL